MSTPIEPLALTAPQPLTVVQRTSLLPGLGRGALRVAGIGAPAPAVRGELRTTVCLEGVGEATDWGDGGLRVTGNGDFAMTAEVAAGGWFRLEVRLLDAHGDVVAQGMVEPVGVGEVFVIAGQSYMCGSHERMMTVDDPLCRAVAASPEEPVWRFAHDPQPQIITRVDPASTAEMFESLADLDRSFPNSAHKPALGSVWPSFASNFLRLQRVPVAFMHVAVGGTRVGFWYPGSQLYNNIIDAIEQVGNFRALLWGQGESDTRRGTTTVEYVDALVTLRTAVVDKTGLDRPWLVAQSTHHTTNYVEAEQEVAVRAAQVRLGQMPGFLPGADTDSLRGLEHRAEWSRGAHFTALAQQTAGLLWAAEVHHLLRSEEAAERNRGASERAQAS